MAKKPLYVDLDGTLVKTDILHESLLLLLKNKIYLIFCLPYWLSQGKAYFKRKLAENVTIDVHKLPYNKELFSYLKEEKKHGRKLILATASYHAVATEIAEYLNIFDDVVATRGNNLTGETKLEAIIEHNDVEGFVYAGNDIKDLPIMMAAEESIIVHPTNRLKYAKRKLSNLDKIFSKPAISFSPILRTIRIHQWTKNILLFVPIILSHNFYDIHLLLNILIAFLIFNFIASGTYVLNDLFDLTSDRNHPRKKNRPLSERGS